MFAENFQHEEAPDYGDLLAPELDDQFEFIEKGDYVRVTPWYAPDEPQFGTVVRVNARVQYALVEHAVSKALKWYSVEEVFLVLKESALKADDFRTVLSA